MLKYLSNLIDHINEVMVNIEQFKHESAFLLGIMGLDAPRHLIHCDKGSVHHWATRTYGMTELGCRSPFLPRALPGLSAAIPERHLGALPLQPTVFDNLG